MSSAGFPKPVSIGDAFRKLEILSKRYPPESRTVHVTSLMPGMVLAEDIEAIEDVPVSTKSIVDGFAIRGTKRQTVGLSTDENPHNAILHPGECVRIMNGGVVPDGADTVVPLKNVSSSDDKKGIEMHSQLTKGNNIRERGSEAKQGDVLLKTGCRIDSISISLLNLFGFSEIEIYQKPKVCVMTVGNENISQRADGNYNRCQLMQMFHRNGFIPIDAGESSTNRIEKNIRTAAQFACFIVVCGESENVQKSIEKLNLELEINGISSKPGNFTVARGTIEGKPVLICSLPQDPVSVWIGANIFLNPFLQAVSGRSFESGTRFKSETTMKIEASPDLKFIAARTVVMKEKLISVPLSSDKLSEANSILELSRNTSYSVGNEINILIVE